MRTFRTWVACHRHLLLSAGLIVAGLRATPAHAEDASDKAAAEALFTQGRDLITAGKVREACERFEASYALDRGVGILLYLADCYERSDRFASAWATFEEASSVAAARGDSGRAQVAKVRADALKPKLVYVQLDVAPQSGELTLTRNGKTIPKAAWGAPIPVDTGAWIIRAAAVGYEAFETKISLSSPQTEVKHVPIPALLPQVIAPIKPQPALPATSTDAPPPPAKVAPLEQANRSSWQTPTGLALGGLGVVGLVASGILTGIAVHKKGEADPLCSRAGDTDQCTQRGNRLMDQAGNLAKFATVAGIGGVALVAGGVTLLLTAPTSGNADHAGFMLQGSF